MPTANGLRFFQCHASLLKKQFPNFRKFLADLASRRPWSLTTAPHLVQPNFPLSANKMVPPFHPQPNGQVECLVDTFKRALLKLKGEGTMSEILETFVTSYRATPNPNTPNGSSPAESLMNRKIQLHIDILRLKQHHSIRRNTKMERQYNRHHGSVQMKFLPWQQFLARDYQNNTETWNQGRIVQKTGNATYNVNVQNSIWFRHSNQLRLSYLPVEIQDPTIPLNILLDTFDLPQQTPETSQNTEVETQELNIRKSVGTLSPTQHLQVDHQLKSYKR